jgi:hypothetical protein
MPVTARLPLSLSTAAILAALSPLVSAQTDAASPAATPAATAPGAPAAPDPAAVQAVLQQAPTLLDVGAVKSNAVLKGKKFYIAEYRVLYEVSGKVSANTRAAYFGGRDYGATRVSVNYEWAKPDLKTLQALTDRAYADFLARMETAGLKPEPADAFVQANGAIYESGTEATKPGAEVYEEVELGYGKRKYLVFAPTGTKVVNRSFIGLGAGNIGKRIDWSKANMEALSMGMVVNLAAQESSGGGSSMFKRGSSANASAAMEIASPPKQAGVLQTHALTQVISLPGPVAVPGQFADLKEIGGYDSQKDALVKGIQVLGALTMGLAGNSSKRVDMAIDADVPALVKHALQGMVSVNRAAVEAIQ